MHANSVIGINKIKFSVLNEILKIPDKYETINFHIDLHDIISFMYRDNVQSEIANSPQELVVSITNSIIALCEHYRKYFSKSYNTNFYLHCSRELPHFQNKIIPFGNNYYDRYSLLNSRFHVANQVVNKSMEFLKDIISYIPHVYYVDTPTVWDTFAMKYIIDRKSDEFNIVMTKDTLKFQLVCNNCVIFRPKRDDSYVIDRKNFCEMITIDKAFTPKHMDYTMYQYIIIINGSKELDVPPINKGFVKLLKLFDSMIEADILTNNMSSKSFIRLFNDFVAGNENNEQLLIDRYRAMIANNVEILGKGSLESIEYSINKDLYDMNTLEEINKHFPNDDKINIYALSKSRVKKSNLRW